jgi:galactose mutarotase-like enzyme
VPFAGRVRNGVFSFGGSEFVLPANDGSHALHGFGLNAQWHQVETTSIRFDFDEPWPFRGSATQRFDLHDDRLDLTMTVHAVDAQPVQLGWHPWFRRDIGTGQDAELTFAAAAMFERDSDGIPSGAMVDPGAGPWDDCFANLATNPSISWGDFRVTLESNADEWTVYNMPTHALCVEPQTGPPNNVNTDPHVVDAGETMEITFTLRWSS